MKSAMPYLGVRVPEVRRIVRGLEGVDPLRSVDEMVGAAADLWRGARYREERYAATALCATTRGRRLQSTALLPLYQEMIVTGAWWDHVDEVSHRIGDLLAAYPDRMRPVLLEWSVAEDLWLRRAAILAQLDFGQDTDLGLLEAVLAPHLPEPRFFVAKAVGWALRQYARVAPDWVRGYVDAHELRPLSRREALKHLQ